MRALLIKTLGVTECILITTSTFLTFVWREFERCAQFEGSTTRGAQGALCGIAACSAPSGRSAPNLCWSGTCGHTIGAFLVLNIALGVHALGIFLVQSLLISVV